MPVDTMRRIDVDITSIHGKQNIDKFPRHFGLLFRCTLIQEKWTLFRRTFFDLVLMGRKLTPFQCTLLDVISMSGTISISF